MSDKKRFNKPGSLQPNIEDILQWNDLPADAFDPATSEEKENFIQDRRSVSYWKDAWRRLRKNTVAMVALVIIILLSVFAFVGPSVVPYTYKQQIRGSESLHPWHYSLEDQDKINAYMEEHNGAGNLTPDEAVEQARQEAEAKGETLSRVDEAKIRAKATVSQQSADEEAVTEEEAAKVLGIKHSIFGYSNKELERKAAGEKVFPHVFGTDDQGRDIMVRVMVGSRVSIIVGICAAILVLIIGALYGSISGYCGGMVDNCDAANRRDYLLHPGDADHPAVIRNLKTGTGTVPELRRRRVPETGNTPWTEPDLHVYRFWSSVLGNHEPYHPWTDPAVKTAGICNSSESTGCKGRTYHQ